MEGKDPLDPLAVGWAVSLMQHVFIVGWAVPLAQIVVTTWTRVLHM